MLGYSCGMREINNLNARYSFLHLGKRCGRLLAGVKGHLWDEARNLYCAWLLKEIIEDSSESALAKYRQMADRLRRGK